MKYATFKITKDNNTLVYVGNEPFIRVKDMIKTIGNTIDKVCEDYDKDELTKQERNLVNDYLVLLHEQLRKINEEGAPKPPKGETINTVFPWENNEIPGRYAVGKNIGSCQWIFYVESKNGATMFTDHPCMMKLYNSYKDAEVCADFIGDDGDWQVIDWLCNMRDEDRLFRSVFGNPDDDKGAENAIALEMKQ